MARAIGVPRRRRAALAALLLAVHVAAATTAPGQSRLDAAGVHACASVGHLIFDLRSGTLPTEQARQRLTVIYDFARTSSNPTVRQTAFAHITQVASADDALLLVMAEQFRAACR